MRQVSKAIRQAVDKVKWDNRWTRSVSEQVNVVNQTTGGQGHAIGSWARKLFQTAGKQGQSERWKVRQDVHKVSQTEGGQSHQQFDLIFLSLFIYIFVMIIIYKLISSLHPTILHEIIYTFLFSIISGFLFFRCPSWTALHSKVTGNYSLLICSSPTFPLAMSGGVAMITSLRSAHSAHLLGGGGMEGREGRVCRR